MAARACALHSGVVHASSRSLRVVMCRGYVVRWTLLIPAILAVFVVFAGGSALAQMAGGQAQVTAVEHQATGDRIRVVVHFDRPVRFVEGTAADPYRIFFDL